jgi:hypothetical protein
MWWTTVESPGAMRAQQGKLTGACGCPRISVGLGVVDATLLQLFAE